MTQNDSNWYQKHVCLYIWRVHFDIKSMSAFIYKEFILISVACLPLYMNNSSVRGMYAFIYEEFILLEACMPLYMNNSFY